MSEEIIKCHEGERFVIDYDKKELRICKYPEYIFTISEVRKHWTGEIIYYYREQFDCDCTLCNLSKRILFNGESATIKSSKGQLVWNSINSSRIKIVETKQQIERNKNINNIIDEKK